MVFRDRREAGRRLAPLLAAFRARRPVVVALPRGGVPVAAEVARALGVPLHVLVVRKLGAPVQPELAIGAIAEGGTPVIDHGTARQLRITDEEIGRVLERERRELGRRTELFGAVGGPPDVRGRTVIVVDDGLATGLTDLAAVRALRERGAGEVVVAAPVSSPEARELLRAEADEVVCHTVPRSFGGVGRWYRDFSQLSDEEVLDMLAAERPDESPATPATPPGGAPPPGRDEDRGR